MNQENEIVFGFPSEKEAQFPVLVQLALMHYICNSCCRRCPVGLYKLGELGADNQGEFDPAKKRFFPFELFPKIADEIGKYPWAILRFHGRGEPLMHPHYVEMIAYAKKAGVQNVTSFTNAVLLNESMAEGILDAGIDLLELSIDAYSEDLYCQFRGTKHFHRVVGNSENFIKARNKRGSHTKTRVIVSAVDTPEFQPEKRDFQKFWQERADSVIFRAYHTYGGRLVPLQAACDAPEVVPCSQLWTRFSINPWGLVNACFNDWADEEIVGDLTRQDETIAKIWRSNRFEEIRKESIEGSSILRCCKTCLATRSGWMYTYQLLLQKLQSQDPNRNLA